MKTDYKPIGWIFLIFLLYAGGYFIINQMWMTFLLTLILFSPGIYLSVRKYYQKIKSKN